MKDTSRYANGSFNQLLNRRGNSYNTFVLRNFDVKPTLKYGEYQFSEGDRIDTIAEIFLGSPYLWHKIMDVNPSVGDPFNIAIGTVLRIPLA